MPIVTSPERVETYLANKTEGKRLPFSCTLAVLNKDTNIAELLQFLSKSLKAGAGAKVIIESDFELPSPVTANYVLMAPESELAKKEEYDFEIGNKYVDVAPADYKIVEVADSMQDINKSWGTFVEAINSNTKICIDLRQLRPLNSVNKKGLVASGPVSFGHILDALALYLEKPSMFTLLRLFGVLNFIILRGGYKKGIITSAIYDTSPYYLEYLNVPLVSLRGSHKKGVIITKMPATQDLKLLCDKVNSESLFLQKHQSAGLYANVCQGIFLRDRGTCLIYRLNLGQVTELSSIVLAMIVATQTAILTHVEWRELHPDLASNWAPIETDNQIAVDIMGMANLLAYFNVSYAEFDAALKGKSDNETANQIVNEFKKAYQMSCKMADFMCDEVYRIPRFERLHTIEPAQSHSYRCKDVKGYTISRGIWPPFSRRVNRVSNSHSEEVKTYDFGNCEVRIDPKLHFSVCNEFMGLIVKNGRPHAISYDTWQNFDVEVFNEWYLSNLQTLYYNVANAYDVDNYARKKIQPITLCTSCAD